MNKTSEKDESHSAPDTRQTGRAPAPSRGKRKRTALSRFYSALLHNVSISKALVLFFSHSESDLSTQCRDR